MLLAIDIGNTTATFAVFKSKRIIIKYHVDTTLKQSEVQKEITSVFKAIARRHKGISGVIACSVVPKVLTIVVKICSAVIKIKPKVVGRNVKVPIRNRYKNPRQVGQDRLVCAYAAIKLYGTPAIVIDFGTAITFDIVSKKNEYLGGIIIPGMKLSAESLFRKTALLPLTKIRIPKKIIGDNTEESILSGLFYGYGEMCSGLIQKISRKVKGAPKVVMTGGYAGRIKSFIYRNVDVVDDHLVFKGMKLLYEESLK